MSIIVRDKAGNRQKIAGVGMPGPAGKSAYQYAADGGFAGTEAEFSALLGQQSNPNLLDNWYFLDPVNQRGQTEYTGTGYMIDRWFQGAASRPRFKAILIKNGILMDLTDNTARCFWCQEIENIPGYGSCTLSLLFDNSLLSATGDASSLSEGNIITSGYINGISCSMYRDTNSSRVIVNFTMSSGIKSTLIAAKLELGSVQTLAHQDASGNWVLNDPPPNKALELAKCQRYLQVLMHGGYDGSYPGYVETAAGTPTLL